MPSKFHPVLYMLFRRATTTTTPWRPLKKLRHLRSLSLSPLQRCLWKHRYLSHAALLLDLPTCPLLYYPPHPSSRSLVSLLLPLARRQRLSFERCASSLRSKPYVGSLITETVHRIKLLQRHALSTAVPIPYVPQLPMYGTCRADPFVVCPQIRTPWTQDEVELAHQLKLEWTLKHAKRTGRTAAEVGTSLSHRSEASTKNWVDMAQYIKGSGLFARGMYVPFFLSEMSGL